MLIIDSISSSVAKDPRRNRPGNPAGPFRDCEPSGAGTSGPRMWDRSVSYAFAHLGLEVGTHRCFHGYSLPGKNTGEDGGHISVLVAELLGR